eukprot:scaffold38466_cov20-Cyclotella_meneghiniana.AAC.1
MADEHTAGQDFATKGNIQEIINTITVPVNNGNITIVSGNNNIINLSERSAVNNGIIIIFNGNNNTIKLSEHID